MARNPDHYAIVIGIDSYSQLPALKAARKDASDFMQWLLADEGGGLELKNIRRVFSPDDFPANPSDARPTQVEVEDALTKFGIRNGYIGKRLYFYFAGHGIGPQFDDVGMLMAHASEQTLKRNIGLRPYRLFFRTSGVFDEIVFILDCCRDSRPGIATGEPDFTLQPVGNHSDIQDFVIMAAEYGMNAFQAILPGSTEPRGVLTRAILEGLTKSEAADEQGRFTASSLRNYVKTRVPQLTQDQNLRQVPRSDPAELAHEIIFATIPNSQLKTVQVRITSPAGTSGDICLFDGNMNQIGKISAADITNQPWEHELVCNRLYSLRHITAAGPAAEKILNDLGNVSNPYDLKFP
jgi:uncharacterized caspase-like protein